MKAAIDDYRCSKVSNNLIFLGYSISFLYQCVCNGRIVFWLQGVVLPIFLLFLLFYLKMLGAADIKLLSVIGGFCGWQFILYVLVTAFLYGAIWSIVKLIRYQNLRERLAYLNLYLSTILVVKRRMPYLKGEAIQSSYTIPFSAAILFAFITQWLWRGGM